MLKLGSTTINKLMLGSSLINKIYLGATTVYNGIPTPFLPSSLPGLNMWLDASDASSIVATGGSVFTASISGLVMTVTASTSGAVVVGSLVFGAGVTANTRVTSLGTGTGGVGTYGLNNSQTVASQAMTSTRIVSQWTDKSGNSNDATQPTTTTAIARPSTGNRTINGVNALEFHGIADFMNVDSSFFPISNGNNTVFIVYALDNTTADQRFIAGTASSSFRWGAAVNILTPGNLTTYNNTGSVPSVYTVTLDTSPHVSGFRRNGATQQSFYDGHKGSSVAATDLTMTIVTIGKNAGTSGNFVDGLIAEIIVYNRALTDAEMNQVGAYINTKYAIAWTNY